MTNDAPPVTATDDGELEYTCPRCARPARHRFYGPCAACRDELATTLGREPTDGEVTPAPIDPKMNVVPNFVATKD